MSQVYIGLGANVGASVENLARARTLMVERGLIEEVGCSPLYHSPALLPEGAPKEWDMPFVNQVVGAKTQVSAEELLVGLQEIEQEIGRTRRGHWGPREIDLDILSYDAMVCDGAELQLPHPHMHVRDFVLLPLHDIAPEWEHPVSGKGVAELVAELENMTAALFDEAAQEAG